MSHQPPDRLISDSAIGPEEKVLEDRARALATCTAVWVRTFRDVRHTSSRTRLLPRPGSRNDARHRGRFTREPAATKVPTAPSFR